MCIYDAIFRTWIFSTYQKLSLITHGHVRKEDENEIETNHTFINWSLKLKSYEVINTNKRNRDKSFQVKPKFLCEIFSVICRNTFTIFIAVTIVQSIFPIVIFSFCFDSISTICSLSLQAFRSIVIFCALAMPMANAVINTKSEQKLERREAPFETYGPPPPVQTQQQILLPTPVYGAPAVAKYPSPGKEYGKSI